VKQDLTCPKCDGRRIWRLEKIAAQDYSVGLGGSYDLKLSAGGSAVAIGHFDAYVCDRCAYSELWAQDVALLSHDPPRGIHLLGSPDEIPDNARATGEQARSDEVNAKIRQVSTEIEAIDASLRSTAWFRILLPPVIAVGAFAWLDSSMTSFERAAWAGAVASGLGFFLWLGRVADKSASRAKAEALRQQIRKLEERASSRQR
jgi:predicted nucleic-acid-binding Zn-ribbon protein